MNKSILVSIFLLASACYVQGQDSLRKTNKMSGENASKVNLESRKYTSEDTLKAVRHLFHRKKAFGIAQAVLCAGLAALTCSAIINYPTNSVTVNQGPSGTQTITTTNSPPVGLLFLVGAELSFSVNGIRQASFYSSRRLNSTLDRLKKGKHLTEKMKSKLKLKDF